MYNVLCIVVIMGFYIMALPFVRKDDFMKKKLFKSALSIVVAFAVVAVSLFAVAPAINLNANAAGVEDTWDGTKVKPTKTDSDGNILIETAEELAWIALEGTTAETKDNTYKVVAGAVFNLNGKTGVTLDSTASEVNDATPTGNNWASNPGERTNTFAGRFDGNGAVIYNMYCGGSGSGAYGGLFPWICVDNSNNTSNFSNVTIKASYIKGYHYAAALVGYADSSGAGRNININGIKLENCYINALDNNSVCNRTGALMVGTAGHCKVTVDSCITINNVIAATDIKGGFVGTSSAFAASSVFKNTVVIGSTPYPTLQSGSSRTIPDFIKNPSCFSNVYTDQDVAYNYDGYVAKVATDDMKGAAAKVNMPDLNWTKLIAFDGEYPDLRVNHTLALVSNGDSGHSIVCSDCGKSLTETHNMVENFDTMISSCDCGYEIPITQMKDSWDGSLATGFAGGTGTKDDPYIIKTAEQMAYVALSTTLDSKGKYFKVTDNAVFNMNGAIGITVNSTADEVKAAPKQGAYNWTGDGAKFNGNFDGNGVIIYNVYNPKNGYGGLFPNINTNNDETSVTIKNVAVKASYFAGYHSAGGIVGNATALGTTQSLNFENCMVENCYITDDGDANPACARTTGTIAGRVGHNKVTVDNCLAKGNMLVAANIVGGFVGNTSAYSENAVIKNSLSLGTLPYPAKSTNATVDLESQISSAECYSNVYTDMEVSGVYGANQVKSLTTGEMMGNRGPENMTLDFIKIWFANTYTPELQMFHNLKGAPYDADPYSGHMASCEDCGIKGVIVTFHDYDKNYKCSICEFVCDHENTKQHIVTKDEIGDCVTNPNIKTECSCGYVSVEDLATAPGHKLVKIEAKEATCKDNGNIEYYTCEECGNIFLTNDTMAAMNTAVSQEEIVIEATKKHLPIEDSNGEIIYGMSGQKHWKICKYCNCEFEKTSHEVEYDETVTVGHKGKCVVCLYEVHEYADVNEKGKPIQAYDEVGHWYNCKDCGKAEYAEHTLEVDENVEGVYKWCEDAEGNSCGYDIFYYSVQSDDGYVDVTGTENAFTKDVITDIFGIDQENPNFEEVNGVFEKEGYKTFDGYDFSPTEEIKDGASVTIKIKVKDIFGNNAAIYYVDTKNSSLKKLDTKIEEVKDAKDNVTYFAITTTNKVGIYAVAADKATGVGGSDNDLDTDNNFGTGAGINGDTSTTSPATKTQSVAYAAVMAAFSAMAIVLACKIKNYNV